MLERNVAALKPQTEKNRFRTLTRTCATSFAVAMFSGALLDVAILAGTMTAGVMLTFAIPSIAMRVVPLIRVAVLVVPLIRVAVLVAAMNSVAIVNDVLLGVALSRLKVMPISQPAYAVPSQAWSPATMPDIDMAGDIASKNTTSDEATVSMHANMALTGKV